MDGSIGIPAARLTRRDFLKSVGASASSIGALSLLPACVAGRDPDAGSGARPNVIVIMTDDQGYGDFGIAGNPVLRTPHLDALAGRSARMSRFYVSPVCAPTRACLMTGRYNFRGRVVDTWRGRALLEPREVTIAEAMRGAGYATGIFGKWHLGDNYPMRPQDQGFEEVLVHRGGGIGQPSDPPGGEGKYTDPVLFHNGERVQERGYCTDVYFDRGMEWMERVHAEGRNFFLYLPTNAPHGPFHDVPRDLYEEYRKLDLSGGRFPQDRGHPLPERANEDRLARIFAMITNIDDNVGRLMERLEALDIDRDTIVVFLTDNGPAGRRYVAGMRGAKASVYEGGIRSPLFVRWPGRLQPGTESDCIAAHIDIMPTLLDACGIPAPPGVALDGRSLLPLLRDPAADWHGRRIVIQAHRGDEPVRYHNFAVIGQRWKLVHDSGFGKETFEGDPSLELYDMQADPLEMRDVAAEHPEVVAELRSVYDAWFDDVGSTRPDNYAPPRIVIGTDREDPVVLTRQDWRSRDRWGASEADGKWLLHAARDGSYDIRALYPPVPAAGEAVIDLGGRVVKVPFESNATEALFSDVPLQKGDLDLRVRLFMAGEERGPWFVEVMRARPR
jgi:arylsulfatase/arylsulfatase A